MEIADIRIVKWQFCPTEKIAGDGLVHIKSLPSVSLVQSCVGTYEIKIGDGKTCFTKENGFFFAPANLTQTITHHYSQKEHCFAARWLFLDVKINSKYEFDEIFRLPAVLDDDSAKILSDCFDRLTNEKILCRKISILYEILAVLTEAASLREPPDERLAAVIDKMKNSYSSPLCIKELAELANMSQSNFYAVFRKAYSCSPIEYLNRIRLSVAADMLTESNTDIRSIAEAVGIYDRFYFSKKFCAVFGISPYRYRKKQQK